MIKCASSRSRPRGGSGDAARPQKGNGRVCARRSALLISWNTATWTDGRSVFTRQEKYWIKTIPSKG
jgi:hypothetical protein